MNGHSLPVKPEELDPAKQHEVVFYQHSAAGRRAEWPFEQMDKLHWFRIREGSFNKNSLRNAAYRRSSNMNASFSVFRHEGFLYVVRIA